MNNSNNDSNINNNNHHHLSRWSIEGRPEKAHQQNQIDHEKWKKTSTNYTPTKQTIRQFVEQSHKQTSKHWLIKGNFIKEMSKYTSKELVVWELWELIT